jgi:hypothetical protein
MKSGYLYVLAHPSDPNLVKIGQTTRKPEERLAEHNSDYKEYTGQIVKEIGQKWELKEYIAVPDPAYAETAFWEAMPLVSGLPRPNGIEVMRLEWEWVRMALGVAKKAGIRPPPEPRTRLIRNREWMIKQLEETEISMIGRYRGLVTGVEFQCAKGHVFKESAGVVANRKSCPVCDLEREKQVDITFHEWAEDNQLHMITEFEGFEVRFVDIQKIPKSKWKLWLEAIRGDDHCLIHYWNYADQSHELATKIESLREKLDLTYKKILEEK